MADEFERLMWQLLRNRQHCNQKFRREHPSGIYIADFYCVPAKLVVDVDARFALSSAQEGIKSLQAVRVRRAASQIPAAD